MTDAATPPLLWKPSERFLAGTNHARYLRWLADERGLRFALDDYDALWRWSVGDVDAFWRSIWDFFDVQADGAAEQALADASMPGAVWFPGTRLNHAEHVFRGKAPDALAIIADGELGGRR